MASDSRLFAPATTLVYPTSSSTSSPSHNPLTYSSRPPPHHLLGREGLIVTATSSLSCSTSTSISQLSSSSPSSYSPTQSKIPSRSSGTSSSNPLEESLASLSGSSASSVSSCSSPSSSQCSITNASRNLSVSASSSSSSSSTISPSSSSPSSPPSPVATASSPQPCSTTSPSSCTPVPNSSFIVQRQSSYREAVLRWSFWPLVLLIVCLPKEAACGLNERRLLHDLLDNYNPLERPVANESEPVVVTFGITLQQIIDVDEKNQLLITNTWLKLEWNDVNLRWNETDYGGVTDLRIPPYKIWKPDVLMYNSADEGFDGTYPTKVVVSASGNCLYIPPGIFKSTCKIDITWFPFDDQRCKMKFGSWTYSGWQLDLQLQSEDGGDLSDFIKNGEWDLIGKTFSKRAYDWDL